MLTLLLFRRRSGDPGGGSGREDKAGRRPREVGTQRFDASGDVVNAYCYFRPAVERCAVFDW